MQLSNLSASEGFRADPLYTPQDASVDSTGQQELIEVLEKQCREFGLEGKYEEADMAKRRLAELRMHEEDRRRKERSTTQVQERLNVEEAHMNELKEFNAIWDQKVEEFEGHSENVKNQLAERQRMDQETFVEKVSKETEPKTPRWSRDLLNQRKIQETLAKQKNYAEAGRVKGEADRIEARETEAWRTKRDAKIAVLMEQFEEKQRLEMAGLLKRIQSGRDEQKQARKSEMERFVQRYNNLKHDLESQHKIIQKRSERYPTSPISSASSQNASRLGLSSSRPTSP